MRMKLFYLLFRLLSGFWFLPGIIIFFAVFGAFIVVQVDQLGQSFLSTAPWLLHLSPEGARALLSTIAGSTITIASLVFSLTLVTLTIASSQLGPRLLMNFMQDKPTQIVLGAFLGAFCYTLVVLQAVDTSSDPHFVPQLSIVLALVVTAANFGFLIYFIHHVADSIQADSVIAQVALGLTQAIEEEFSETEPQEPATLPDPDALQKDGVPVCSPVMGYIQAIDYGALVKLAASSDLTILLPMRAGHFIAVGEPLAHVAPEYRLDKSLQARITDQIVIGNKRTMAQDLEFSVHALVDIGLRALSPGINDPHTANSVIDYLGGVLAIAGGRYAPLPVYCDEEERVRVVVNPTSFAGLVASAFDEIRQAATGQLAVQIQLVKAATRIARALTRRAQCPTIAKQVTALKQAAHTQALQPCDAADLDEVIAEFETTLGECLEKLRD